MIWLPPSYRPPNESAGWLGYYCRVHLPVVFDLVNLDGVIPTMWHYLKCQTGTYRIFEEKPSDGVQSLHASEERVLRDFVRRHPDARVYVIHEADRLGAPSFPIQVTRLGNGARTDTKRCFERSQFDDWLCTGLSPTFAESSSEEDGEDLWAEMTEDDREAALFESWRHEHADHLGEVF